MSALEMESILLKEIVHELMVLLRMLLSSIVWRSWDRIKSASAADFIWAVLLLSLRNMGLCYVRTPVCQNYVPVCSTIQFLYNLLNLRLQSYGVLC